MADRSMELKAEALLGPRSIDLEEAPDPQDLPSIQEEPGPHCADFVAPLVPPNVGSGGPGMDERLARGDPTETAEGQADMGLLEGPRDVMEDVAITLQQEPPPMDQIPAAEGDSSLLAPSGTDESNPSMELKEEEDSTVPRADLIQDLLERLNPHFRDNSPPSSSDGEEESALGRGEEQSLLPESRDPPGKGTPCPLHIAAGLGAVVARGPRKNRSLLSADTEREDLLGLLHYEGGIPGEADERTPLAHSEAVSGGEKAEAEGGPSSMPGPNEDVRQEEEATSEPASERLEQPSPGSEAQENKGDISSFPAYQEDDLSAAAPGPCDPEDLREGVLFAAKYLGSTQLVSERSPPSSVRMAQAQEAMDRVKAPEGESQPMTEVDLFVSTQRIKVLTTDSQEAMMDHPLQTISFIADIGNVVVLMARRKLPRRTDSSPEKPLYKMICHVFHSADAQLVAQAIGQAFSVAYQLFLRASGITPQQLGPSSPGHNDDEEDDEDAAAIRAQGEELYNADLAHFSKQENCEKVVILKPKGAILGLAVVESGWGSLLPTVVIANLMHGGPAERSGKLSIGDRITAANGTSLVGLPLATSQSILRELKNQTEVTLSVVHCPPVTTAIVRRPDTKFPLGFCVENGIICSLMRGGIAERGGIRVGHHILEINGQSVVAMPHQKVIQILTQAVREVRIKTMPASTYRLLTGQEQPVFL
nr:amyloid-beta A4 precursor protein-binding family A member 3 [Anolis sagrei ordinatus]